ncbi:unnamed protein product [Prunus armeniaca]
MTKLCEKYRFQHSFSMSYNPSSNGQAEALNKILCNVLKKMVSGNKRDGHERLPEALWGYRMTIRNSTGCTLYNLVFGSEAVLQIEVQLPLLRVALQLTNPDENANVRLAELEALDEKDWHLNKGSKYIKLKLQRHSTEKLSSYISHLEIWFSLSEDPL